MDWSTLLDTLRYDLWIVVVGLVTNTACAVLGCFLVLRRMSLLGDAISHSIIAGIALAYLLTGSTAVVPMLAGALAVGLLTAVLTQSLTTLGNVPEDSSMGVVFTSLFAFGAIVVSQVRIHLDTECVLTGNLSYVLIDTLPVFGYEVPRVLMTLIPVCGLTLLFAAVLWKELTIASFDPLLATAMGISAAVVHYLLMGMVALVTVSALEAIGAILVVAMLIVPAAAAHLLTERVVTMVLCAVGVGAVSAVGGAAGARWLDVNAAGLMAVVAGLQFLLAVLLAPRHGLLAKWLGQRRLNRRIAAEDLVALLFRHEERLAATPAAVGLTRGECLHSVGDHWSARQALRRLRRQGFVAATPDGRLRLTEHGRHLGQSLVRSHRLWETYLEQHFDLPADHLHAPAERIEHFIGPALQQQLADALHRPHRDPHGSAIPPPD